MSACGNAKSFNQCLYDAQGMLLCENKKSTKDQYASGQYVIETFGQQNTMESIKQKIDEVRNNLMKDLDMSAIMKTSS
jgi:NADPH-dependent curcumin reductase CurA